jgi:hypothetical protein
MVRFEAVGYENRTRSQEWQTELSPVKCNSRGPAVIRSYVAPAVRGGYGLIWEDLRR